MGPLAGHDKDVEWPSRQAVYELLQAPLPRLDEQDPVHAVLADAPPSPAAARGERA